MQDLDAEVLAISTDNLRGAESIVRSVGIPFPILYNPEKDVVQQYGVYNIFRDGLAAPSTFIIDKEGVIRWKYISRNRYTDRPSTEQVLEQLRQIQG